LGTTYQLSPPSQGSSPEIYSALDRELMALPALEDRLQNARFILLRSRNASKSLAPINRLPVETLSEIFRAANDHYCCRNDPPHNHSVCPTVLAGVCHLWRGVALNLPTLWSHLDLAITGMTIKGSYVNCAKLWAERSSDIYLDIRVEEESEEDQDTAPIGGQHSHKVIISKLDSVLSPIAPRIRHLELGLCFNSQYLLISLLFATIGLGSVRSLNLWYSGEETLGAISCSSFPWGRSVWPDHWDCDHPPIDDLLRSINRLTLRSIPIDWRSTVYHNLTELSLDNLDAGLSRIASILKSSPSLCTLSMDRGYISVDSNELGMIPLEQLQSVRIDGYGCYTADILSLLEPGTLPLTVNITLPLSTITSVVEKMREFFARSNVVSLHVKPRKSTAWFAQLRSSLSHLEKLTIEGGNIADPNLIAFLDNDYHDTHDTPWPKLHTLSLVNCYVDGVLLKRLVSIHSIQKFRFIDHRQPEYTSGLASPNYVAMEYLERQLSEHVPDVMVQGDWLYHSKKDWNT
jgi:hypothetical protein